LSCGCFFFTYFQRDKIGPFSFRLPPFTFKDATVSYGDQSLNLDFLQLGDMNLAQASVFFSIFPPDISTKIAYHLQNLDHKTSSWLSSTL
jgi:hypothetical protein